MTLWGFHITEFREGVYTYIHTQCKRVLLSQGGWSKSIRVFQKSTGGGIRWLCVVLEDGFDVSYTFENLLCINLGCGETT